MKKLLSILFLLMFVTSGMIAQKTYTLLSGVSNYGVDSINLHTTTKDVKQLQQVFKNQGFTNAIVTSKYANHANIVTKLNAIVRLAKANDRIIFYFSGHGTPGGFVTSDRSLFNYQELVNILSKAKAKQVYCIIDACMSGSVKSIAANNFGVGNSQPSICFLTASDATELSRESSIVGHGYFTKALLKGLRGMSDKNSDRAITLAELFKYVYNDVTYRTKDQQQVQHPQLVCPASMQDEIITKW